MEKPLTKQDIRKIFDEKFDEKFDQKFDERIQPFIIATQLEFQKMNQKIDKNFQWVKENIYEKLDSFISMYKKHDEEIVMLSSQSRRLNDRVDGLDERVVKLESQK